MKVAYCDCFSGISGDMFIGALIDASLPLDLLRKNISGLSLEEPFELAVQETHKGALRATQFQVILPDRVSSHRSLADISAIIQNSSLSKQVKEDSLAIFHRLAEAEARVHGVPVESIHFHEVGATDAIVDIVGVAVGLEALGIEKLYASALPLGSGLVETAHGTLPLPAPATLELLSGAHAPTFPLSTPFELVTPTGAAILSSMAAFEQPELVLQRIGLGAGRLDLPWPNVLRLWVGEAPASPQPQVVLLETNIDDMNPEFFGHVMERLFGAGALDVYMTPIFMKKNRPATMLSVIVRKEREAELAALLLNETSTFGLRVQPFARYEAERLIQTVETPFGPVPVKLKILDGNVIAASPEYEVCSRLARQHNVSIMSVYHAALQNSPEKQ
jgi:uncharacterized protein (TIGR00299 family) protein